jgi:hypothetical protein
MMITAVAAFALVTVAHGWNKDQQIVPLGAPYWQSAGGDDDKGTVGIESWCTKRIIPEFAIGAFRKPPAKKCRPQRSFAALKSNGIISWSFG